MQISVIAEGNAINSIFREADSMECTGGDRYGLNGRDVFSFSTLLSWQGKNHVPRRLPLPCDILIFVSCSYSYTSIEEPAKERTVSSGGA